MKDILVYYARCNALINRAMDEVIVEKVPSPYDLPLEGYFFHTLGQILDHLWASDMIWMKAFLDIDAYGMDLSTVGPVPVYGSAVFARFEDYGEARTRLDAFIQDWVAQVEEEIFAKTVSRRAKDGTLIEKPVWKALVHWFNHQTHHRGQVSHILDRLGIENNYSNMLFLE